jgi:phosphatidate cytidylyltransferase
VADSALAQRIATALVMVAICLPTVIFLPASYSALLLDVVVVLASWEWSAFIGKPTPLARVAYLVAICVAILAVRWALRFQTAAMSVVWISLGWWAVAFLLVLRYPWRIPGAMTFVCGFLVLVPAWFALYALLESPGDGRWLLLLSLAIVWSADVGAYFAGRYWGRVKLAPQVSPGKTWEGVLGGVAFAAGTAMLGAFLLGHSAPVAAPLGMSVAAISIVGDLTVSMFKRNVGLKDSGHLFPGHGGVLDRVDSVTAAAPLFLLEASWVGWVTL